MKGNNVEQPTKSNLKKLIDYIKLLSRPRTRTIYKDKFDGYPRNKPCPCGSNKKYKYCCWSKHNELGDKFYSEEFEKQYKKEVVWNNKKYNRLTKGKDNDQSSSL